MKPLNVFRRDGWTNLLAGLGKRQDKTQHTRMGDFPLITDPEFTSIWMGDGLGKRIVSLYPEDMTRAWINIPADKDGDLIKALADLNAQSVMYLALCWARLYGGAIVLLGTEDGEADLSKPRGARQNAEVKWLKVYPRTRVQLLPSDIVTDPTHPRFEEWETTTLTKLDGTPFRVHHSRCLVFKGEPVPADAYVADFNLRYWGMSSLQAVYSRLANYGAAEQGLSNLLLEFAIGKYKLPGLADILASNDTTAIYNRMEVINASKSVINSVMLGEGEEFTRDVVTLTGTADLLDRFQQGLSAVTGYPVSKLFGRTMGGLAANGEGDARNYYDTVGAKQESDLQPPLLTLCQRVNSGLGMVVPEDELEIDFNPVWTPSQKELTDMRKTQADTDKIYIDSGVLSNEEVRQQRFEGGYSFDTMVEDGSPAPEPEPEPALVSPAKQPPVMPLLPIPAQGKAQ